MRRSSAWILGSVLLVVFMVLGVSCAKKTVTTEAAPMEEQLTPEEMAKRQAEAEAAAARAQAEASKRMQDQRAWEAARTQEEVGKMSPEARRRAFEREDIYFDFDKYLLTPKAMRTLDDKTAWLREHPGVRVVIEGHADERGSNEYNLALGDRRANSAKGYLIRSGVAGDRLTTVSYGEERPLCTQSMESCWWKNRRDHFVIR